MAIYQLEQEFAPYLFVDFLPNTNNHAGGIILEAGDEVIEKNITFDNPNDMDTMRQLLWKYLLKYHNIRDITDKNGCIKDFSEYTTFKVRQGYKLNKLTKDRCFKFIRDCISKSYYNYLIKHPVYRLNTNPKIDKNICIKIRSRECWNNYPKNSQLYQRCMDEVNWLCQNGYPNNKVVEIKNNQIKQIRTDLFNYLIKNNMKVNRKMFDKIIDAGLFDHIGNRMGNKINFKDIQNTVDEYMLYNNYYNNLLEGFDYNYNFIYLIVLILIILFYFFYFR